MIVVDGLPVIAVVVVRTTATMSPVDQVASDDVRQSRPDPVPDR